MSDRETHAIRVHAACTEGLIAQDEYKKKVAAAAKKYNVGFIHILQIIDPK